MSSNFSTNLLEATVEFVRAIGQELGNEFGQEKVYAMLDAFDPELKGQVLIYLLMGKEVNAEARFRRVQNTTSGYTETITAIKAIRLATGCGLREAKDATDAALDGNTVTLKYEPGRRKVFEDMLQGTGFEIL